MTFSQQKFDDDPASRPGLGILAEFTGRGVAGTIADLDLRHPEYLTRWAHLLVEAATIAAENPDAPDLDPETLARTWLLEPHLVLNVTCDGDEHRVLVTTRTATDEHGGQVATVHLDPLDHPGGFDLDAEAFLLALSGTPATGCLLAALSMERHRPHRAPDGYAIDTVANIWATYATARLWATSTFPISTQARSDLIQARTSPAEWEPWNAAGVRPGVAKQFLLRRVSLDAALPWIGARMTTGAAADLAAQGHAPSFSLSTWRAHDFNAAQGRSWYAHLRCTPAQADAFRLLGIEPKAARDYVAKFESVTVALDWLWALHAHSDRDTTDPHVLEGVAEWRSYGLDQARARAFEDLGINVWGYSGLGYDLHVASQIPSLRTGTCAGLPYRPATVDRIGVTSTHDDALETMRGVDLDDLRAWYAAGYTHTSAITTALECHLTRAEFVALATHPLPAGTEPLIDPRWLIHLAEHMDLGTWNDWVTLTRDTGRWNPAHQSNFMGAYTNYEFGLSALVEGILLLHHHGISPDDVAHWSGPDSLIPAASMSVDVVQHPDVLAECLITILAAHPTADPLRTLNGFLVSHDHARVSSMSGSRIEMRTARILAKGAAAQFALRDRR